MLCTSGFVDNVIFSHNRPCGTGNESKLKVTHRGQHGPDSTLHTYVRLHQSQLTHVPHQPTAVA